MKYLNPIALILIIVGGLNWLLVGLFKFNLVHFVFGSLGYVENIVYIIVGIAALVSIPMLKNCCPKSSCNKD
ncbi:MULTISPECIES: DUF378 domain-containing protein [Cysteiniphilum]|uniref:DUF378 domain-containing protein n=1 Tax=Cysteiniphilum TaxID=2056696 RepID=UPI00177CA513|nr:MULTISPECIES: DUF378 domain-containing protein [Cysteiniphilum]